MLIKDISDKAHVATIYLFIYNIYIYIYIYMEQAVVCFQFYLVTVMYNY
jgi:hypothetical protein